jgi:hypothetical protein
LEKWRDVEGVVTRKLQDSSLKSMYEGTVRLDHRIDYEDDTTTVSE